MNEQAQQELKKLQSGFFGFWTQKIKVAVLILLLLISSGFYALYKIPKESSPNVSVGMISIVTSYPGVNPADIDSLITDKIEKEIEWVDGVKKYTSTSSMGLSFIKVDLETNAVTREVLTDLKDKIDGVDLPADARDPVVSEIDVTQEKLFALYLYAKNENTSKFDLLQKAQFLKNALQKNKYIGEVDINPSDDYEIQVLIDKNKMNQLGLSMRQIAGVIQSYNKNTPIGNYTIDQLNYDFRFDGELTSPNQLKNIIIRSGNSSFLTLGDIATIETKYKDTSIMRVGFPKDTGYTAISMIVKKARGKEIFASARNAKQVLEKIMKSENSLSGLKYVIFEDQSKTIIKDYVNLANSAWQTLALVFLTILFFISFKEALIIVFILPLSFFITFLVLKEGGYSMNFLTNFSLILSLTIAIDTIIVVIEWATEKQKLGYDRKTAVLMAIEEFKAPLISWTLTTLSVFLPLMFLPGMMGKFLAFIPITVFTTLLASLIIALTLSSTIYYLLAGRKKYFFREEKIEENMQPFQRKILEDQRQGKREAQHEKLSLKEKILHKMWDVYFNYLEKVLPSFFWKMVIIVTPIVLMVLSMIILPSKIGFTMIPPTDKNITTITLEANEGKTEKALTPYISQIEEGIQKVKNIKLYSINISQNTITVYVEAIDKEDRENSIFDIEKNITKNLQGLKASGFEISSTTKWVGPPTEWGAVWVKLIAEETSQLDTLKKVASDFLNYAKSIPGTKNQKSSSAETPWQFVFSFDEAKLSQLGLTPNDILNEIYFYTNGIKAGSISSKFEDNDIVLKIKEFADNLSPEDVLNTVIPTKAGKVRIWDVATYSFTKAVSSVNREDGNITITVGLDPDTGYLPSDLQPKLDDFAKKYDYPPGVHYEQGGENEENADLLVAMLLSFAVAVFLMFFILVTQFNSYAQPIIILFSVVLSLLWVNVWLYLTGNPFSLPAIIGFIALSGVVINDSIVLIDRINGNLAKGIDSIHAVAAAGKSRLQPVLVTTITTALWVFPLTFQSAFWAGLAYTIMFGIAVGSALTIFCTPLIYYSLFLRKKKRK